MTRRRVPRPGWRCWLCPGHPWCESVVDPFLEWQAHYLRFHYERPER